MRIVCPYVAGSPQHDLLPETKAALDMTGHPWTAVDVSGSQTAYSELFERMWMGRKDFCVVEADKIVHHDTPHVLQACPQEWCSFRCEHRILGERIAAPGMACTRFRASLMERFPDLPKRVLRAGGDGGICTWEHVDGRVYHALIARGVGRDEHGPTIGHLHY